MPIPSSSSQQQQQQQEQEQDQQAPQQEQEQQQPPQHRHHHHQQPFPQRRGNHFGETQNSNVSTIPTTHFTTPTPPTFATNITNNNEPTAASTIRNSNNNTNHITTGNDYNTIDHWVSSSDNVHRNHINPASIIATPLPSLNATATSSASSSFPVYQQQNYGKGGGLIQQTLLSSTFHQYTIPIPAVPEKIYKTISNHVTTHLNQPLHLYENRIRTLSNKKNDLHDRINTLQNRINELENEKEMSLRNLIDIRNEEKNNNIKQMEEKLNEQYEIDMKLLEERIIGDFHKLCDKKRKVLHDKQSIQSQHEKEQSMKRLKLFLQDDDDHNNSRNEKNNDNEQRIDSSETANNDTTTATVEKNEMVANSNHDITKASSLEDTATSIPTSDNDQNKSTSQESSDRESKTNAMVTTTRIIEHVDNHNDMMKDVDDGNDNDRPTSLLSILLNDNEQIQNAKRKIETKQQELYELEEASGQLSSALDDSNNNDMLSEMKWLLKEIIKAEQLRKKH